MQKNFVVTTMIKNLLKELAVGDCHHFKFKPATFAHYCAANKKIYLHENATADIIETILNHEFIHEVLHRTIDKKTNLQYDNLFRWFQDVDENGCVKEK